MKTENANLTNLTEGVKCTELINKQITLRALSTLSSLSIHTNTLTKQTKYNKKTDNSKLFNSVSCAKTQIG